MVSLKKPTPKTMLSIVDQMIPLIYYPNDPQTYARTYALRAWMVHHHPMSLYSEDKFAAAIERFNCDWEDYIKLGELFGPATSQAAEHWLADRKLSEEPSYVDLVS